MKLINFTKTGSWEEGRDPATNFKRKKVCSVSSFLTCQLKNYSSSPLRQRSPSGWCSLLLPLLNSILLTLFALLTIYSSRDNSHFGGYQWRQGLNSVCTLVLWSSAVGWQLPQCEHMAYLRSEYCSSSSLTWRAESSSCSGYVFKLNFLIFTPSQSCFWGWRVYQDFALWKSAINVKLIVSVVQEKYGFLLKKMF